jgi:L-lactate dehydrogenase complex protein LldF
MLHYNRTLSVAKHDTERSETMAWKMWKLAMTRRSLMDVAGAGIKTQIVNVLFKDSWGKRRDNLHFQKSFKEQWSRLKK